MYTKCLIIGSGPAGYTASIYTARAFLNPILLTGYQPGGQLTTTTIVENYPGYPKGINGSDLIINFKKQAINFNVNIMNNVAVNINLNTKPFLVKLDNEKNIHAESIILAMGSKYNMLNIESEKKYFGLGVSTCATCDGFFYKNKIVGIIGGGDTACEEAIYLSKICKSIYMIIRKSNMSASKYMQKKVSLLKNIKILYNNSVYEILGNENKVTSVILYNNLNNKFINIALNGIFIAIGFKPNTEILSQYKEILLDHKGYIKTYNNSSKTKIDGLFACGDIQDSKYRQAITAAGSGCIAGIDAEKYINQYVD